MAIRIDAATADDIRFVALNMRDRDLSEFSAVYPFETREELAEVLAYRYGQRDDVIVAYGEMGAIAVGGALELRPNVLSLFFLATDQFDDIVLPLTKFVKRRLLAPMVDAGAHRIEAVSLHSYNDMHRWLEVLGLTREAEHPAYGKRREKFVTYAWTADARATRH